ncbi:unnamed protein product [Microthlaspi erraticum]|uniref:Uncharacterized protein n=1 Tax=Microthlaspi erraticum TaxID=1685480 RepID=A0A6D2I2B9_9BRAS|nr:unnamed protein product [Microthlaspi erraticum]
MVSGNPRAPPPPSCAFEEFLLGLTAESITVRLLQIISMNNHCSRFSYIISDVHSLTTTISLKMEIPETAWKDDPHSTLLAMHQQTSSSKYQSFQRFTITKRRFDP